MTIPKFRWPSEGEMKILAALEFGEKPLRALSDFLTIHPSTLYSSCEKLIRLGYVEVRRHDYYLPTRMPRRFYGMTEQGVLTLACRFNVELLNAKPKKSLAAVHQDRTPEHPVDVHSRPGLHSS